MFRRSLAMALAFLLTGISLPAQTPALGAVTQSSGGHLNNATASVGTTLYDGDSLSTETAGSITLSAGSTQLTLAGDSAVLVNHDGAGLATTLQRGSLAFRVENGGALKINAVDVHIRPQSAALTAGQVTLENCAVVVTSRIQSLEVSAGKETKIVEEGKSYRVSLEGACKNKIPLPTVPSRFLAIPISIGIITIWGVHKALESPDRP